MVIKPLGSNLLLKQLSNDGKKTASGIILSTKEQLPQAIVMAVGDEVTKISVGQTVLLKAWGGEDVDIDTVKYKVIPQEEILAIIEV